MTEDKIWILLVLISGCFLCRQDAYCTMHSTGMLRYKLNFIDVKCSILYEVQCKKVSVYTGLHGYNLCDGTDCGQIPEV